MQIVDFFYIIARENLRIKSFTYGKPSAKGAGSDKYPMIWLDDPITGGTQTAGNLGALQYTVNVDILGIPTDDEDVINVQDAAFLTGLGIPERAKVIYKTARLTFMGFTFISVRDYYDDKAAGIRFTYSLSLASPVDRCANDYDPTKVFANASVLPQFSVDAPDGCAIFNDHVGLPNFSVAPDPVDPPGPPMQEAQFRLVNHSTGIIRYEIRDVNPDTGDWLPVTYSGSILPGASWLSQFLLTPEGANPTLYINGFDHYYDITLGANVIPINFAVDSFTALVPGSIVAGYIESYGTNEIAFTDHE